MSDEQQDVGHLDGRALDKRARQVLAELELISAGKTYSYAPVATKSGFSSSLPGTGEDRPPHLHFRAEYDHQVDDQGRRDVVRRAERERDTLKRRTLPAGFSEQPESDDERRERLLDKGEGVALHEAAYSLNCSPTELRRIRKDDSRDVYTGTALPGQPTERQAKDERAVRARELKARNPGMSNRQIAMIVGVSHPTVAAYLAKTA